MLKLFRQPLVWFLCISGALFVVDARTANQAEPLIVTAAVRDRISLLWETQMGAPPSSVELESLIAGWIEEEALYREAIRLGLEREDSIIRRRLVQKLNFIAESDPVEQAEEAMLEAFYREHIEDYTLPERLTFRQLTFREESSARSALDAIADGEEPSSLGESTMLNRSYSYRSALDLNSSFGLGFAAKIDTSRLNEWQGPLNSSFGYHLLFLTGLEPEQATPFQAAREKVLRDYQQASTNAARQRSVETLLPNTALRFE